MAVICGCGALRLGQFNRSAPLVGEWIDVSHTTAGDTALWILRDDGYDRSAHLLAVRGASGTVMTRRTETRYASWYLRGDVADSTHRAICFVRRLGRDGATCVHFSLDTIQTAAGTRRRLVVKGYQGEHRTADRELVERRIEGVRR